MSAFEKDRAWHVPEELDLLAMQVGWHTSLNLFYNLSFILHNYRNGIILMQKACQVLVGHHDFSSFRAAACQVGSIFEISIFTTEMYGFIYHLVSFLNFNFLYFFTLHVPFHWLTGQVTHPNSGRAKCY